MQDGGTRSRGRVYSIKTMQIDPNPDQPRQEFEPVALANLATSLRQHGMLQPVIVRPVEEIASPVADRTAGYGGRTTRWGTPLDLDATRYHLVAGERRWRAAQLAGLDEVPALVCDATSREMLELALVENIQREDLSPLEEARAYEHMTKHLKLTQDEVALRVGRNRATIANRMRLLNLTAPVRRALNERRITEGHARALLALDNERQEDTLQSVLRGRLSVRETERLVRRLAAEHRDTRQTDDADAHAGARGAPATGAFAEMTGEAEDLLRRALGTKVTVSRQGHGGKIVIDFYSDEELRRVCEHISGIQEENI
jgi:ParB family chromosome partitioning protein